MVSVRIARRLFDPIILDPMENFMTTWLPLIVNPCTSPTFTPAMRTLSPLFSPPVSLNSP
ncbi:Uncharacterised protein [Mycobacteroides abscessus subsp. abscessus]|nr:Uncharacterised protein [Mycobacteroides abscessus subsp. abscessus]